MTLREFITSMFDNDSDAYIHIDNNEHTYLEYRFESGHVIRHIRGGYEYADELLDHEIASLHMRYYEEGGSELTINMDV